MDLLIFGRQASGKGTQAELLAERYDMQQIGTGNLLRGEIAKGTELGREIDQRMKTGALLPTEMVMGVLRNRLAGLDSGTRLIFDGFPRAPDQVGPFLEFMRETGRRCLAVVLDISVDEALRRIQSRLTCGTCAAVYSTDDGLACCAKEGCGGELKVRQDDQDADAVRARLKAYEERTVPVIEAVEHAGVEMLHVDGAQSLEAVSQAIFSRLDQFFTVTSSE